MKKIVVLFMTMVTSQLYAQNLESRLQEIKERNNLVGLSVCLVGGNKITQSHHLGLRDVERNLPVDENTVFRIASISKMVTVTALMQLYDKGLFHLDDDVSKYLGFELRNPNFPNQPITFKMLMSHTSGLRDGTGYNSFLMASYSVKPFPAIKSVVQPGGEFYTEDMWSKTESVTKEYFTYANINFGLLGTLVECISGERFDKYCIAHIFEPLCIKASFDVRDIPDINNVAAIYRNENGKWVIQTDGWKGVRPASRKLEDYVIGSNAVLFAPQGGLRISAADLSRFMIMHMNNGLYGNSRILSEQASKLMHNAVWKYNGENGATENDFFLSYGLGTVSTDKLIPGAELIGHSGDAYGLLSGMYFIRDRGIGIIFITNGGEWKPADNGWQSVEKEVANSCYMFLNR